MQSISLLATSSSLWKDPWTNLIEKFRQSAGPEQHGCLAGPSTTTTSTTIHDRLLDMDTELRLHIIANDAYGKISHNTILSRLIEYDFLRNFIRLIVAESSEWESIMNWGRAQRSHLTSPRDPCCSSLWLRSQSSVRKIPAGLLCWRCDSYCSSVQRCSETMTEEYLNMRSWANEVGLTINPNKSKHLAIKNQPPAILTGRTRQHPWDPWHCMVKRSNLS